MANDSAIIRKHRREFKATIGALQHGRKEALRLLDEETLNTVKKLIDHRDNGKEVISLDATKHLTKLQGLEIERHRIEGEAGGPVAIVIKRYGEKQ